MKVHDEADAKMKEVKTDKKDNQALKDMLDDIQKMNVN